MTRRTRYFVGGALAILAGGLIAGLVAHYGGFSPLSASRTGPAELSYVPPEASVVAYANVRDVMTSEFRERLRRAAPEHGHGHGAFREKTGIDIETDIDHVVACLVPGPGDAGLVLARGRFNTPLLESLAREQGGVIEEYRGKRLVRPGDEPVGDSERPGRHGAPVLAFIEPGLLAIGSEAAVKRAIDVQLDGQSVSANEEMMRLVGEIELGSNAWAVGRFDALTERANLPEQLAGQIPPITWFAASGQVNGGVRGTFRAEARDEAAADNLRDVVRGFLALARLQTGPESKFDAVVRGLELGGAGRTVAVSFVLPADVLDSMMPRPGPEAQ